MLTTLQAAAATARLVPALLGVDELPLREAGHVLVEVDADAATYYEGHVPGALVLDWLDHLQHPQRRGLVDVDGFAALMDSRGIARDTHVVLLGDADNRYAALAYWYFTYYGHERVSLLDGGRRAWLGAGLPLTDADTPVRPTTGYRVAGLRPAVRATRDDVLRRFVGAPDGTLLFDCRSPAEHGGRAASVVDLPVQRHRVNGHIPGSRNLDTAALVDSRTGRLRPAYELAELFEAQGLRPGLDVACYCRGGDRSALMWFVLSEVLGHPGVRHYDGGWAEWGSLMDAPVSHGA